MRLRLTFARTSPHRLLPLNYQYLVSAWIYHALHEGNADFATWLHDQGFQLAGKQFRMFTFSQLDLRPYQIHDNLVEVQGDRIRLTISFCLSEASEHFLIGLFAKQRFSLGDANHRLDLVVDAIELLPEPHFHDDWQAFRTLSPVCVSLSRGPDRPVAYLAPDHPQYAERLAHNLLSKQQSFQPLRPPATEEGLELDFECLSRPRSRLVRIAAGTSRETQVKGYGYHFRLRCAASWKRLFWQAGLGEKNAQGFGCIDLR
ncbi:MAG: CRISPR-associated endoribonuclease Cas6 [Bacteroidota bacterium]